MRRVIIAVMLFAAVAVANQMQRDMLLFARLASRGAELWTPADLDGLFSWWKADSLDLSNDDLVSTWTDSSGNGYSVTASGAARPTFKTGVLNALPAVRFNGTTTYMEHSTAAPWKFLHDGTKHALVAVTQNNNEGTGTRIFFDTGNRFSTPNIGAMFAWRLENAYRHAIHRGVELTRVVDWSTSQDYPAGTRIVSFRGDPANATASARSIINVNGGSDLTGNTNTGEVSTANPTKPAIIGAGFSTAYGNFHSGDIYEIVIVDEDLSTADRQKLEGYLAHKWGLTANLPAGHPYKNAAPTK